MLLGLLLFCTVARANCKAGNTPSANGQTCVPNADQCEDPLTTAGCATCTGTGSAQTCLTCSSSKKVRPDKKGCIASCPPSVTTENSGVCECTPGNKPSSDGTTCVPNADQCEDPLTTAGCATCTGTGSAQTCLTCSSSKKVRPDKKGCIASCPPSVTTENSGVCECTPGNKPSSDGTTCVPNADQCEDPLTTAGCATCTGTGSAQTCLTCSSSKKVRPDKKGCIASCPPSVTTENSGVCECTPGNKPSSDGTTCVPNADQCEDPLTTAGCATCTGTGSAQTCLTCSSSKKVRPDKKGCIASCPPSVTTENSGVCECTPGNKPSSDGTTCVPNADQCEDPLTTAGCATCTGTGSAQTCLTCSSSKKVRPDKKGCIASCPPSVTTENSGVCECTPGNKPSSDGTTCVSETACNTPNCKTCDNPKTDNEICTECNDGDYLTPTKQCTQSCGAIGSYYDGDKACEPCDPSCAGCTTKGPAKCTLCPPGKRLQYTNDDPNQGGSCVDECKAEVDGCAECGAVIGGTKYCSKCKEDKWAPQNGVCANSVTRNSFCTNAAGGVCTQCAADHFLQDGGCYKLGRQPGIQICTLADSNGGCQTCANSLQPNDGACPSCHSTCKTCSTADSSDKCTSCAAGYYMVGSGPNTCISCDSNSGSVKGVAGCMSCAPPPNNQGSVVCYLINDSGSTNKSSGLSTGAIAGISVAVVVVVGGLVGFLCWWFLCRGKA
uniref:Variant-specific surface protein AS7 n=1 Tax=Giardia intestinalis TaxID=5741 RepID=Q8I8V6_GIAIN|nr:variant-specific surface protein AS7 [Giardia intestinalis]